MASVWKNMAGRLGRLGGLADRPRIPAQPGAARPARGRQVAALQRRRLIYAPQLDGRADPGEIV